MIIAWMFVDQLKNVQINLNNYSVKENNKNILKQASNEKVLYILDK